MRLARTVPWLRQMDLTGNHFVFHPAAHPYYRDRCGDKVTIIVYNGPRFRNTDQAMTGAEQEPDDPGQFDRELMDALNVSAGKVLLWSAYAAAARGINFITTDQGMERDFELFCLLNDPYYTRHTRPKARGFSMEMFQAFTQVVRDENDDWRTMSRDELLFQFARKRSQRLRKEHVIDITRKIFQALGRGERRPNESMHRQLIYVSAQASQMVHLGLRHAPELRRRASPAQRAVLDAISAYNDATAMFRSQSERALGATKSLRLAAGFRAYTARTPGLFRTCEAARVQWHAIFDRTMFTDPTRYLEKLKRAGVPAAFRDGCYARIPITAMVYTRRVPANGTTEASSPTMRTAKICTIGPG